MTREEALKGESFSTLIREVTLRFRRDFIGMTLDPAYASFTEDLLGTITPGKRADYVILSRDIMSIPARKILNTAVVATVLDGRPVYGRV